MRVFRDIATDNVMKGKLNCVTLILLTSYNLMMSCRNIYHNKMQLYFLLISYAGVKMLFISEMRKTFLVDISFNFHFILRL